MNISLSLTTPRSYRIAVGSFYFTQGLVFSSWASRIPDIRTSLHLNEAALGSVLFAIPIGQLAAMALSGYLVSRFGSRRMLAWAALLYPGTLIFLGAAPTVWFLSAGLFFFGMAANLHNISVNTQGVEVERLYGRSIMATFHGLWSLAGFTGGLLSTWMAGTSVSPFIHFCFVGMATTVILMTMYGSTVPHDRGRTVPHKTESRPVFVKPDRYIVVLGVIAFGCMACEGVMYDWSGVYFQDVVRPPEGLVRLGYVAAMCTMTCGRFLADRLVTRYGASRVIVLSGFLMASGLLTAVFFPSLLWATLGFLTVGFGVSSVVPICYSEAGKSTRMLPGVALATVSTIGFLGFLLGPPVIGFIAQALSLRWAFALVALMGLMTAGMAARLKKNSSVQ